MCIVCLTLCSTSLESIDKFHVCKTVIYITTIFIDNLKAGGVEFE